LDFAREFFSLEICRSASPAARFRSTRRCRYRSLNALEAAHEQGIIHRDLKAGNVMITPDGVVKVRDFSLAGRERTRATRVSISRRRCTNDSHRWPLAPDGKRFLLLVPAEQPEGPPLEVIVNPHALLEH
jgi:serine/threonine protein kinase